MAAGISTQNRATKGKSYLLLKLIACAGQRVTLFEYLDWKTRCLMHTLVNQLRSSEKDTWAFHTSVDGLSLGTIKSRRCSFLKSGWRDHSRCSVPIHKIDITTRYCSWVEINASIQEKTTDYSMLHRHLIFSVIYWYNRQVLILVICIYV